jgi:hypothetical protein
VPEYFATAKTRGLPPAEEMLKQYGSWKHLWSSLGLLYPEQVQRAVLQARDECITAHINTTLERGLPSKKEFAAALRTTSLPKQYRNLCALKEILPSPEEFLAAWYRQRIHAFGRMKSQQEICDMLRIDLQTCDILSGDLPRDYLHKHYGTVEKLLSSCIESVPNPDGKHKQRLRSLMVELASKYVPGEISYLGLENVNFRSYIALARELDINPERSVVVESEEHRWRIMRSIIMNRDLWPACAQHFAGLNLRLGPLDDVLLSLPFQFNIHNLDYEGQYSADKARALQRLASRVHAPALLCVTLNNSSKSRKWFLDTYAVHNSEDRMEQLEFFERQLQRLSFSVDIKHREAYTDTCPMLFGAYLLKR